MCAVKHGKIRGEAMFIASLSSFLGSVWFATTVGLIAGWMLCKKKCNKC